MKTAVVLTNILLNIWGDLVILLIAHMQLKNQEESNLLLL